MQQEAREQLRKKLRQTRGTAKRQHLLRALWRLNRKQKPGQDRASSEPERQKT